MERLRTLGRTETSALINPLTGAVKTLIGTLLLITWLDNAGYDIGALLAGLGIGGVAVALVLQRPLEDVFAAFTLFTQQPIRVGDFGRFGKLTGTVEEITLRTTRICTLENTVVAVPNARFAAEPIENISARQRILYRPLIRLDLQTPPAKIEEILESIRSELSAHPRVLEDGRRVRLIQFGEFAVEVEAFAYIDTVVFTEYLEIAEALNLAIMRIVEGADARFAYLGSDTLARLVPPP
jgi:MscS family membrane protein